MNYYLVEKIIATWVIPGIVIGLLIMEVILCSRELYVYLWNRRIKKAIEKANK